MEVTASIFPHVGRGIRYTKSLSMPDKALPTTEAEAMERSRKAIAHLWPASQPPAAVEAFIGDGYCLCKGDAYEVWWKTSAWIASTNPMYLTGAFNPSSFPRSTP
jgi:hypothetical protein